MTKQATHHATMTMLAAGKATGEWSTREPRTISVHSARAEIRYARREGATVHIHETTSHGGVQMHVAHAHFPAGTWDDSTEMVHIYEIPTAALTAL
ncbi:hypothetical protein [Streptomyces mayteni]